MKKNDGGTVPGWRKERLIGSEKIGNRSISLAPSIASTWAWTSHTITKASPTAQQERPQQAATGHPGGRPRAPGAPLEEHLESVDGRTPPAPASRRGGPWTTTPANASQASFFTHARRSPR